MKLLDLSNLNARLPIEGRIFVFFVSYVLIAGLTLQMVVLPLTPWHAGDGLMIGGDWILFQEVALSHAAQIREFGWSVAQLRPDGHGPSGLAAFVYAFTGVIKPWILLPIHAVVYAVAAIGLFWVVKGLSDSNRLGLFALAPMCLMPSLAMVWGQLHKDVWAVAAVLLLLGFWMRLFTDRPLPVWVGLILLSFVNLSLWWMRPYTLQIALLGQFFLFFLLIYLFFKMGLKKSLLIGIVALIFNIGAFIINKSRLENINEAAGGISHNFCGDWIMTLPYEKLDSTLMTISCTRNGLMRYFPNAKSNLDANVTFLSAQDVIAYLPRAAQVGVLAPFPNMWFAEGTSEASQIFRTIAGVETGAMYAALLGILLVITLIISGRIRVKPDKFIALLAMVGFAMVWVGIYALATGNVGSLYRVRFPIMLLWMGLGLWSWSQNLIWWRNKNKPVNETYV